MSIPSVFISEEDYNKIVESISSSSSPPLVTIDDSGEVTPEPFPDMMSIVRMLLLVFLMIWAFLTVLHFCRRTRGACRRHRDRRSRVRINQLHSVKYKDVEGEGSKNTQCSICLEGFELGENIKLLPCEHGFHKDCLAPWLDEASGAPSCPICRTEITVSP